MHPRLSILVAAAIGLATVAAPAVAHDRSGRTTPAAASTLVGVASGAPQFSTLTAAVVAAGLADTLSGPGPFTVFAPDDDAFAALPEGAVERLTRPDQRRRLTRILTYHVVPGRISASDLATAVRVGGGSVRLTTVQGGRLTATDAGRGRLRLTDGQGETFWITDTDIAASNGVIHVIDGVMTPGH